MGYSDSYNLDVLHETLFNDEEFQSICEEAIIEIAHNHIKDEPEPYKDSELWQAYDVGIDNILEALLRRGFTRPKRNIVAAYGINKCWEGHKEVKHPELKHYMDSDEHNTQRSKYKG
jgi:hypothetical protein